MHVLSLIRDLRPLWVKSNTNRLFIDCHKIQLIWLFTLNLLDGGMFVVIIKVKVDILVLIGDLNFIYALT